MAHDYEYEVETPSASRKSKQQEETPLLGRLSGADAPQDRRLMVFFIFGFLGLASLLPWNFFITAKKYFDYKFRNTSLPANISFDDKDHATEFQVVFESDLSIVSNGSNLFFMILTMLLVRTITVKTRILVSTCLVIGIFIATTVLVKVDTDSWQEIFFILTLVLASFMSGVQSVLTGSVLGLSALFPPIYSQSAMIGQAAGGTFSAVVSILTHATGGGPISSALIYFLVAIVITVLSLVSYICLHFMKFSKFYMISASTVLNDINEDIPTYDEIVGKREFFVSIIKKTWVYCLSVCLVFTVTLAIFPAVCSSIQSMNTESNPWTDTYFTPVICFLFFNVGDFLGRLFTFVCKFPGNNRPGLMLFLSVLRIAFIPLLMMCNAQPRYNIPVYLDHDAYPAVLILLMGLTNGYLGTLCMSFGPLRVIDEQAEGAGIMLALAMTTGLAGGSGFSYLLIKLL